MIDWYQEKCIELLPEVQQQQARSAIEPEAESPPLEINNVVEQRLPVPPLASPLFGHPGANHIREPIVFQDSNLPSTSAWASQPSSQPSFLQERLGLRSPVPPSPILSNIKFPKSNRPTTAPREFGSLGDSPVQGRRLRYEAEQPKGPLYPAIDMGDMPRGDGIDAARPAGVEKQMPVKMNGTDPSGNGFHFALENGLRTEGLHIEHHDTMDMDQEGSLPANGKRHPSDRAWLQRAGEKEASKQFNFTGIDGENGPPSATEVLPWESARRLAFV